MNRFEQELCLIIFGALIFVSTVVAGQALTEENICVAIVAGFAVGVSSAIFSSIMKKRDEDEKNDLNGKNR